MTENEIGTVIVDCAIGLHKELGPGLLETVYEVLLAHDIEQRGPKVKRQVSVPIVYHGIEFDEGFRADLIVENKVIVELKAKEKLSAIDKPQLLTYLRLSDKRVGLIINFHVKLLRDGIYRVVNNLLD